MLFDKPRILDINRNNEYRIRGGVISGNCDVFLPDNISGSNNVFTLNSHLASVSAGLNTKVDDLSASLQNDIYNLDVDLQGQIFTVNTKTTQISAYVNTLSSQLSGSLNGVFSPLNHVHVAAEVTGGVFPTDRLGSGSPDATKWLRGDGTWTTIVGGSATVENFDFEIEGPAIKTYRLRLYTNFAGTINECRYICGTGSTNFKVQIDTTDVVGLTNLSAGPATQMASATSSNVFGIGNTINLVVSNVSISPYPLDFGLSIKATRV